MPDVQPIIIRDGELERMQSTDRVVGVEYSFVHLQSSPSAVWTITHNLGRKPLVCVIDSANDEVWGFDVKHVSNNQLILTFGASFSGEARVI